MQNKNFQDDIGKNVVILAHRKLNQRETADKTGKKQGQFMSAKGELREIVISKQGAILLKIWGDKPYPSTIDVDRIQSYKVE